MIRLTELGVGEMMELRARLRDIADQNCPFIEDAAASMADLFRSSLLDDDGRPACALVRVYKTHLFAGLDTDLQAFARGIDPAVDTINGLRCLVLLATAGDLPQWNSRLTSRGHRAIPLSSEEAVAGAPMILQLVRQLGIDVSMVLRPEPGLLLDAAERPHNVFYVADAHGSPSIPAQQNFVVPHAIKSVIGFGGLVSSGDLFATILFSRVAISPEIADLFKILGLNFKLAMMRHADKKLFKPITRPASLISPRARAES